MTVVWKHLRLGPPSLRRWRWASGWGWPWLWSGWPGSCWPGRCCSMSWRSAAPCPRESHRCWRSPLSTAPVLQHRNHYKIKMYHALQLEIIFTLTKPRNVLICLTSLSTWPALKWQLVPYMHVNKNWAQWIII